MRTKAGMQRSKTNHSPSPECYLCHLTVCSGAPLDYVPLAAFSRWRKMGMRWTSHKLLRTILAPCTLFSVLNSKRCRLIWRREASITKFCLSLTMACSHQFLISKSQRFGSDVGIFIADVMLFTLPHIHIGKYIATFIYLRESYYSILQCTIIFSCFWFSSY